MFRGSNTDAYGKHFDGSRVSAVWEKASPIPGYSANVYRRDACGTAIQYSEYGRRGKYGWEIDHVHPVALGGSDKLKNLQPLHWQNNQIKADEHPNNWKLRVGIR